MECSRVEIAAVTRSAQSVNGMLLCVNNRVCECNCEAVRSRMSWNERIRVLPSANSRIPTCAHDQFDADWSCKYTAFSWHCILLYRLYIMERLKWQ